MPPVPTTTTVSPSRTLARWTADPYPFGMAHASSAAGISGRCGSTFTIESADTTVCSANAPIFETCPRFWPSVV